MKSLNFASTAKFDGVIICGDFNHPGVSWTEQGYAFRGRKARVAKYRLSLLRI